PARRRGPRTGQRRRCSTEAGADGEGPGARRGEAGQGDCPGPGPPRSGPSTGPSARSAREASWRGGQDEGGPWSSEGAPQGTAAGAGSAPAGDWAARIAVKQPGGPERPEAGRRARGPGSSRVGPTAARSGEGPDAAGTPGPQPARGPIAESGAAETASAAAAGRAAPPAERDRPANGERSGPGREERTAKAQQPCRAHAASGRCGRTPEKAGPPQTGPASTGSATPSPERGQASAGAKGHGPGAAAAARCGQRPGKPGPGANPANARADREARPRPEGAAQCRTGRSGPPARTATARVTKGDA